MTVKTDAFRTLAHRTVIGWLGFFTESTMEEIVVKHYLFHRICYPPLHRHGMNLP
jgi:hypothetical protein